MIDDCYAAEALGIAERPDLGSENGQLNDLKGSIGAGGTWLMDNLTAIFVAVRGRLGIAFEAKAVETG